MQLLLRFAQNESAAISCLSRSIKILFWATECYRMVTTCPAYWGCSPRRVAKQPVPLRHKPTGGARHATDTLDMSKVLLHLATNNSEGTSHASQINGTNLVLRPFQTSLKPITQSNFWTPRGWYQIAFLQLHLVWVWKAPSHALPQTAFWWIDWSFQRISICFNMICLPLFRYLWTAFLKTIHAILQQTTLTSNWKLDW